MTSLVKGSNMSAYFVGCIHVPMHYTPPSFEELCHHFTGNPVVLVE